MTMKNDTKIKGELTCFKIDMRYFTNFDSITPKSKRLSRYKSTDELPFMTLKGYANFEKKLTFGLKKGLRNLA